jgi:hypothetical protein
MDEFFGIFGKISANQNQLDKRSMAIEKLLKDP